ncbi:hypothetical protein [Prescottella subtropica]|uniref:hypothetical protein n=1 Tax=Prescottella subtropica TaxID=2545757 RepID=UPI0010F69F34|nr:hypothetical protein [Prescottella subtropica]
MTGRPLILLDIDGVCSPMCPADQLDTTWTSWRRATCGWNKGWVPAALGPTLTALTMHTDIWWCSGWESEAHRYGTELGVPHWPYIPILNSPDADMFKLPSVIAQVGERPVWWFDDEHNPASTQWAAHRTATGIPTVAANIDSRRGLHPENLAAAANWAYRISQEPHRRHPNRAPAAGN